MSPGSPGITSGTTPAAAPVADWVEVADLQHDPFPAFARMRQESAVHWVPAIDRYLVTRYEECHRVEMEAETFSAFERESLMLRAMGHSMLRKDDPEHAVERSAWQPSLRPGAIRAHWREIFEENTERCLDQLVAAGPEADLVRDYAAPLAAENLRRVLGLRNATQADLQEWSQALIDATGNYADDPEIWARGERAFRAVDDALDELVPYYREHPDHTLISGLVAGADDPAMSLDSIRANLKMTIGGGLNEPRDVLSVTAWALLSDRPQLEQVLGDPTLWKTAFDEAIRWIAPIGMYPRQTTREVQLGDVLLPAGARLGVAVISANRDERIFPDAATYDLGRERKPNLAFGGGAHYCAGAWVAKTAVAEVGLPRLFGRLPGLRVDSTRETRLAGWVFRGLLTLPVTW